MAFIHPSRLFDLTGRVAVITGAGVGIGAGIAYRFAQAGAAIVINYRSHEEEARIVAAEVEKIGRQVLVVQADVSKSARCRPIV
jgi:3-oxoacyl-[acyl-carrier protein] reductase